MAAGDVEAVLVTGGLGTGKTTVSTALGELLEARGVAGCVVDLDWLCWAWSPHLDSGRLHALLCDNLRVITPRLLEEGLRRLVLCRALLEPGHVRDIRDAVGVDLRVVRLTVARQEAEQRLRQRDAGDELAAHLAELETFERAAARAVPEAPVVETTGRTAADVALQLVTLLGWSSTAAG